MLTFVLVHGAFHGGWCWSKTAAELTKQGARVFAPSLTGLGDRQHLFSPSVNLATHVQDIAKLLEYERLDNCILVGHSYAGNVVSGVADRMRERIGHCVFLDASVPPPGTKSWGWASLNPHLHTTRMNMINEQGSGMMIPPFPATAFGLTDPQHIEEVESRLTPMPLGCYTDPIILHNGGTEGLKCSYIAAANPAYDNMRSTVEWISKDPSWILRKINTGHDMMISEPIVLANMLMELAATQLTATPDGRQYQV